MDFEKIKNEYKKTEPPEELRERISALDIKSEETKRHKSKMPVFKSAACLAVLAICATAAWNIIVPNRGIILSSGKELGKKEAIISTEQIEYAKEISIAIFSIDQITPRHSVSSETGSCCQFKIKASSKTTVSVTGGEILLYDKEYDKYVSYGNETVIEKTTDIYIVLPDETKDSDILLSVTANDKTEKVLISYDSDRGTYIATVDK